MAKIENLSHSKNEVSFAENIETLKSYVISRGDLSHVTCKRQIEVIDELCAFPLGRFIIERRGANGFWTDYMVSHPTHGKITGLNNEGIPFTPLESWFLNECPIILAHQERFLIFQSLAQKLLKDNSILASVPCGLMRDLIALDFSHVNNVKLLGIDIDSESLSLAQELALQKGLENITLMQKNAWDLSFHQEIDLITSSGLNVYESDPRKVLELYTRFFIALKPNGHLITSVLTYPPEEGKKTDWDMQGISEETLLLNRILHKDILDVKWRNFRSISEITEDFKKVGFSEVTIYFDKHRIFPTVLAKK